MINYNTLMYILLLINNTGNITCNGLSRVITNVSHDVLTALLHKDWDSKILLWYCIQRIHPLTKGYIIIDYTFVEKCFSFIFKCVSKQRSGKYKFTLFGMTIVMVMWADGKWRIPLLIRIWYKSGKKKTELAMEMLSEIRNKLHYKPYCVVFDSAYATKEILKRIDDYGWAYVTRCPKNRFFNGVNIWRYKKQGFWTSVGESWFGQKIKAVRIKDRFYICNRLTWSRKEIMESYDMRVIIEETFRILKQKMGFIGCQLRDIESYTRHLYLCLIAFLVLEATRIKGNMGKTIYQIRENVILGKNLFYPSVLNRISKVA